MSKLNVERLEDRVLLAGNVVIGLNPQTGTVTLTGDDAANIVTATNAGGNLAIQNQGGTLSFDAQTAGLIQAAIGQLPAPVQAQVAAQLQAGLAAGQLQIPATVAGQPAGAAFVGADLTVNLGGGNDVLAVANSNLGVVDVDMGAGDDTIAYGNNTIVSATIEGGEGTDELDLRDEQGLVDDVYTGTDPVVTGFEVFDPNDQ